jgi:hypothetical protein
MPSLSVQRGADSAMRASRRLGRDGLVPSVWSSIVSATSCLFRFNDQRPVRRWTADRQGLRVQSIFLLHHTSTAAPKTTATNIRANKPPKPVNKNAQSSCMHH